MVILVCWPTCQAHAPPGRAFRQADKTAVAPRPAPAAIFYALTFPVQRPQLFVLSWPYFPQLQVRGCWVCCCERSCLLT